MTTRTDAGGDKDLLEAPEYFQKLSPLLLALEGISPCVLFLSSRPAGLSGASQKRHFELRLAWLSLSRDKNMDSRIRNKIDRIDRFDRHLDRHRDRR